MSTQNFVTTSIVRIYESWTSLLVERPEIDIKLQNGKVVNIILPVKAKNITFVILSGKIAHLEYFLNGEFIKYTSPISNDSTVYDFLKEYDKKVKTE